VFVVLIVDVEAAGDGEELAFEVADQVVLGIEYFYAGAEQIPSAANRKHERIVRLFAHLESRRQQLFAHEPAEHLRHKPDRFLARADHFSRVRVENVVALHRGEDFDLLFDDILVVFQHELLRGVELWIKPDDGSVYKESGSDSPPLSPHSYRGFTRITRQ